MHVLCPLPSQNPSVHSLGLRPGSATEWSLLRGRYVNLEIRNDTIHGCSPLNRSASEKCGTPESVAFVCVYILYKNTCVCVCTCVCACMCVCARIICTRIDTSHA